ncbi:MAG TPA: universal stress protein [Gemmatimonadales bacterium]
MTWNPIIVGVDLSPASLRAATVAARLAAKGGAGLIPVYAVPLVPVFSGAGGMEMGPIASPQLQEVLVRGARGQVTRALEGTVPADALARLVVESGPAPFVLADVARRIGAELIVLGGKPHGALARGLGRSTAHHLVRTLDVPVLVVGASDAPIATLLAAVDLSAASGPTIEAAEQLTRMLNAQLRLLHVVEPLRFLDVMPDLWDQEAYVQRSQVAFTRLASRCHAVPETNRAVLSGVAADTIAEAAGAWRADLIVVGSHGKGWVDRLLVGSTTERLVTELPASVLVVPTSRHAAGRVPRRAGRRASRGRSPATV